MEFNSTCMMDNNGWYGIVTDPTGKVYSLPYTHSEMSTIGMIQHVIFHLRTNRPYKLYLGSDGVSSDETRSEFYLSNGKVLRRLWGDPDEVKDLGALIKDLEETNTRMRPIALSLYREHGNDLDLRRCQETDRLLINLRAMIDAGMIQPVLAPVA